MHFDRLHGDVESGRDLLVALTECGTPQDIAFAVAHSSGGVDGRVLFHQRGERVIDVPLAVRRLHHGLMQLAERTLLQHVRDRSRAECLAYKRGVAVACQHDDFGLGCYALELSNRGQAAAFRHRQIEHEQIGRERLGSSNRALRIADLFDDVDSRHRGEQRAQSLTNRLVVVGEHDAQALLHFYSCTGSPIVT